MKRVSILGSTGSVGVQTLQVIAGFPERYQVVALAAGRNLETLTAQVAAFEPQVVSVADPNGARALEERFAGKGIRFVSGNAGLEAVAVEPADLVVAGLVGAVGLRPTLAAIRTGADIALANKEVLVMAGALVLREIGRHGNTLIPVDSEHSAIFQALAGQRREDVSRVVLTASGGPFRTWSEERIARATRAEALNHPNWDMGPKITIDSASLMNKGLEVIEARWLFDLPSDQIDVVVHPQSIVHSLVEFVDGSVLAQLGLPDMRVPIAVALAHPERLPLELPRLDLAAVGRLDFEIPDRKRFPCLDLAFEALRIGEAAPAVLNAANEISVAAFLEGQLSFPEIARCNSQVLDAFQGESRFGQVLDLDEILEADAWARRAALTLLNRKEPS